MDRTGAKLAEKVRPRLLASASTSAESSCPMAACCACVSQTHQIATFRFVNVLWCAEVMTQGIISQPAAFVQPARRYSKTKGSGEPSARTFPPCSIRDKDVLAPALLVWVVLCESANRHPESRASPAPSLPYHSSLARESCPGLSWRRPLHIQGREVRPPPPHARFLRSNKTRDSSHRYAVRLNTVLDWPPGPRFRASRRWCRHQCHLRGGLQK